MKNIIVSRLIPEKIMNCLYFHGFNPIKTSALQQFSSETRYHPDLQMLIIDGKIYVPANIQISNELRELRCSHIVHTNIEIEDKYPNDCVFNAFVIGKTVICGKSSLALKTYLPEHDFFIVKQGYAACSTIRLDDTHFITSDRTIEKCLTTLNKSVLYVPTNGIELEGFSCGFIGGCGFAYEKTLYLSGIIENEALYMYTKSIGYKVLLMSDKNIYDYGGFIVVDL